MEHVPDFLPPSPHRAALERAAESSGEGATAEWLWLDQPHEGFRYPEFPRVPQSEEPEAYARALIDPRRPERVRLASDLLELLRETLLHLKGASVWTTDPVLTELLAQRQAHADLRIDTFPRDPEEWGHILAMGDAPGLILLSNPHRVDGFFYPQDLYENLYRTLRRRFPQTPIFSEESYNLFSFNSVAPGTLKSYLDHDPNLALLGNVYPALSPQGPPLAWIVGDGPLNQGPRSAVNETQLRESLRPLMAWASRQDAAVQEFHRRMLALKQGLRELTETLNPVLRDSLVRVPYWPEAGFFLTMDLSPWMARHSERFAGGQVTLAEDLARRTRLGLLPGETFGQPRSLGLCYAARPRAMRDAGRRLLAYLLENQ